MTAASWDDQTAWQADRSSSSHEIDVIAERAKVRASNATRHTTVSGHFRAALAILRDPALGRTIRRGER